MIVADSKNRAVKRLTPDGVIVPMASNLKLGPSGLAEDATDGSCLATVQHAIIRVLPFGSKKDPEDPDHKLVSGLWGGSGCENGLASDARFRNPQAIAALPNGSYLIADSQNHIIRKVRPHCRFCVCDVTQSKALSSLSERMAASLLS